jgi:exodeoxyribonuclease (lambda-induced)
MYKIYDFPQRSQLWFKLREGRLTFSNLGTALGNPKFETVEALGYRLRNNVEQTFSILAKDRMRRGTEMENEIRERYQKKYPDRKVTEVGFVVPVGTPWKGWKEEWNNHVGASPDGLINSDGIIEIKCSDKMPKWITEDSDIYPNYYAQMK